MKVRMERGWHKPSSAIETVEIEWRRGKWKSECSGDMRIYEEEHQRRRRLTGLLLTLRLERVGSNQD